VIAAHTTIPVIGVPIPFHCAAGMDSLLATVQMPAGIPVATVAIGKPGATNAGIFGGADSGVVERTAGQETCRSQREVGNSVMRNRRS